MTTSTFSLLFPSSSTYLKRFDPNKTQIPNQKKRIFYLLVCLEFYLLVTMNYLVMSPNSPQVTKRYFRFAQKSSFILKNNFKLRRRYCVEDNYCKYMSASLQKRYYSSLNRRRWLYFEILARFKETIAVKTKTKLQNRNLSKF